MAHLTQSHGSSSRPFLLSLLCRRFLKLVDPFTLLWDTITLVRSHRSLEEERVIRTDMFILLAWHDATFVGHVMGGLKWALDGASTKAYGVGLVGNDTPSTTNKSTTAPTSSASGGPTAAKSGSVAAASESSSKSSGSEQVLPRGVLKGVAVGILGTVLGMGLAF